MDNRILDPIDAKIVSILVDDARLSARALARAVGMSPTGVAERLGRLYNRGIIVGYHAEIDPAALGWGVEAIIGIIADQNQSVRELVDQLMTRPEVITAYIVTGRWDVMLSVRSPSHQALQNFVVGSLPLSPGFVRSETMVCWEARRTSTAPFLAAILETADGDDEPSPAATPAAKPSKSPRTRAKPTRLTTQPIAPHVHPLDS